nr:MAG TPA: Major tail protein [Caudoviricetes sp.]
MYIAPNSVVRILRNCPLDNTYDHTIYFSSASAQSTYFQSLTAYTHTNLSYNRVNRGQLKIQRKAEDMYNCNYMMFQNTSFGNRWFYAFITSVEYVSNEVSLITFEIDVMQTWFFDVTLEQCFVEREHVMNDTIGANLQPEPVDLGDYVYDGFTTSGHMSDPVIVLNSNVNAKGEEIEPTLVGGIFHGTGYMFADADNTGVGQIRAVLDRFGNWDELNENVVACYMYYRDFLDTDVLTAQRPATYQISKSKNYSDLDGYTPKNNKLYTYPYNYLLVTTDSGDNVELHYEYFSTNDCQFNIVGDVAPNPEVICEPRFYKGCNYLRNEKLTISGFPQCTFNIDSFKAWLSQTASNPDLFASTAQSAATGATTGGAYGAAAGAAMSLLSTAIGGAMAAASPPVIKGTAHTSCSYASGAKDFYFMPTTITADFAERIDNFLDVYGYAVNEHKVPNRSGRAHWNYVKNKTTNLIGNAPADDVNKIVSIYNKGITFWRNGSEVGNYSLDNTL